MNNWDLHRVQECKIGVSDICHVLCFDYSCFCLWNKPFDFCEVCIWVLPSLAPKSPDNISDHSVVHLNVLLNEGKKILPGN